MSQDNDYTQDQKSHWKASVDPQAAEKERAVADRLEHAMIMVEDEVTSTPEPPPPVYDTKIARAAGISTREWAFIRSIRGFRRRFALGYNYWNAWTIPVLRECGSYLLKNYKTAADLRREKEELARAKKAAWEASQSFQKSPAERAAISARTKAAWERRKARE